MIVLDTSTLVLLAKSDLLSLLAERTPLLIPDQVRREAVVKPELYDAQMIARMVDSHTIKVVRAAWTRQHQRLQGDFDLGLGEAAALLLAQRRRAVLGTDDGPAIKAAKVLGVPFVTAIHILVELYQKGRIDRAMALAKLERLQRMGRYSAQIVEDARGRLRK